MGFPRQGHWSGLPCPLPGDLPDPGMEIKPQSLTSPSLGWGSFTTSTTWKAHFDYTSIVKYILRPNRAAKNLLSLTTRFFLLLFLIAVFILLKDMCVPVQYIHNNSVNIVRNPRFSVNRKGKANIKSKLQLCGFTVELESQVWTHDLFSFFIPLFSFLSRTSWFILCEDP